MSFILTHHWMCGINEGAWFTCLDQLTKLVKSDLLFSMNAANAIIIFLGTGTFL